MVVNKAQNGSLSVPRSAVIKLGKHSRVVKALGEGRYKSVPVKLGLEGIRVLESPTGVRVQQPSIQVTNGLSLGDQVVISAQFLLDSESNIDDELLRIETQDEMKSSPRKDTKDLITSQGKVEMIMQGTNTIRLTHEAIPELEWPVMTMDFSVSKENDISALRLGQIIEFKLVVDQANGYLITEIK